MRHAKVIGITKFEARYAKITLANEYRDLSTITRDVPNWNDFFTLAYKHPAVKAIYKLYEADKLAFNKAMLAIILELNRELHADKLTEIERWRNANKRAWSYVYADYNTMRRELDSYELDEKVRKYAEYRAKGYIGFERMVIAMIIPLVKRLAE